MAVDPIPAIHETGIPNPIPAKALSVGQGILAELHPDQVINCDTFVIKGSYASERFFSEYSVECKDTGVRKFFESNVNPSTDDALFMMFGIS